MIWCDQVFLDVKPFLKGMARPGDPYLTFTQLGEQIGKTDVVPHEVGKTHVTMLTSVQHLHVLVIAAGIESKGLSLFPFGCFP